MRTPETMDVGGQVEGGVSNSCPNKPPEVDEYTLAEFFEKAELVKQYVYDVQAGLAAVNAGALLYSIPADSRILVGYGNDERYNQGRNLLLDLYYNPGGRRRETKQLQNEQQLAYVRSAAIRAFEYRYKFDAGMPRVLKRVDLPRFSLETSGLDIQAEQSTYAVDFPLSNPLWLGNDQEREQAFYLADTTLLLRQFLYLLLASSTKQLAIGFGQNYFIDACPVEKKGKTVAGHTLYVNLYDLDPTYNSDLSTFLFKEYTLELAVVWKNQEDQAGYNYQDAPSTILLTLSQAYDSTPARRGRRAKDTWDSRYMVELINKFETSVLIYNRRLGLA